MKVTWGVGAAMIVALVLVAMVATRVRPAATAPSDAAAVAAVPVSVDTVRKQTLALVTEAVGRAEAKASVSVTSRIDGQVAEVGFLEGHRVRKGQLLLRLDPAVPEAQHRQAEGIVARDQAQLQRLRGDFQRNQSLAAQGFISAGGLIQSETDLKAMQATLKSDLAALDDARLQVDFTAIRAPIDGVAGTLQLPIGSGAKANTTTLLVINQVDPIHVTFTLPEAELGPLKRALAHGAVPVTASIAGIDRPVLGHVDIVDNAVDPATGAITVKGVFANPDGLVTPGQFARVRIQVGALAGVLAVPSSAVESGVDGAYAFVVNADSTIAIRPLSLGAQAAGYRVVLAGLKEGERVVTSGQASLHNQARVVVLPASAASR